MMMADNASLVEERKTMELKSSEAAQFTGNADDEDDDDDISQRLYETSDLLA